MYRKPAVSYSPVPLSSIIVKKLLGTHQGATGLQWMTCSFIMMNMGIVFGNVHKFLEQNLGTAQKVIRNGSSKLFQGLVAAL